MRSYAQWFVAHIFGIKWRAVFSAAYLRLSEAELSRKLRSLGQSKVLRLLETPLQRGELVAGIDSSRLADLFWFSVHHAHLRLWLFFHYETQGENMLTLMLGKNEGKKKI